MHKSENVITSRHYLIMAVIAFAVGIVFSVIVKTHYVLYISKILIIIVLILLAILVSLKICFRHRKLRLKTFLLPLFILIFVLSGVFRIIGIDYLFPSPLAKYDGRSAWLSGTVSTQPKLTKNGYSYYFEMKLCQVNDEHISEENIIIYIPKSRGKYVSKDDKISCWTRITKLQDDFTEGIYSYNTNLHTKRIFYSGTTENTNPEDFTVSPTFTGFIKALGKDIGSTISKTANSLLMADRTNSAILTGILVGDKAGFSDNLYAKFSSAGLSHIVAVSGMHLSILFGAMISVFGIFNMKRNRSLLLSVPIILLFAATANFTPSVCRASIMILTMIAASLFRRRYSPINALFLSLGIILIVSPYSIFSPSLTLSFCATLGILVYFKYIYYFLSKLLTCVRFRSSIANRITKHLLNAVITSVALSISVFIGTAFFSLMLFGSVSVAQFLTNIWVIPLVTVIFCLGYIVCIAQHILPPLALTLRYPLNRLVGIIASTADVFGKDEFALQTSREDILWVMGFAYLGLSILLYRILKTFYDFSEEKKISESYSKATEIRKL